MYKIQKKTSRRKKEKIRQNERIGARLRKIEGNDNTSKRLTIPEDFLRDEVTSAASHKTTSESQDVHELLRESLKLESFQENKSFESSDPFRLKDIPTFNKDQHSNENCAINKSKSIFKEINHLYERNSQNNYTEFKTNQLSVSCSPNEVDIKPKFCGGLLKQLKLNVGLGLKPILVCKSRIFSEVKKIDNILSGKTKMDTSKVSSSSSDCYIIEDKNQEINWNYFGKSEWVYETPPRQKIIAPKVEDSQLQPAVLCNTHQQTQIFEWKPHVKVDVNKFDPKSDITVNTKLMEHIATLRHNIPSDVDMTSNSTKAQTDSETINSLSQSVSQVCDNVFNFPKPKLVEKNPLVNIFSRPSKRTIKDTSGTNTVKRKLEESLTDDIFSICNKNESSLTKENVNPLSRFGFDKKKKFLPQQNDNREFKINLTTNFKMDDPITIGSDFGNNLENLSDLGFNFKNGSRNTENSNVFDFSKSNGII